LTRRRCLFGVGYGSRGVPIEVAQILLAGKNAKQFHLFIVDEFQRLNGCDKHTVQLGKNKLNHALDVLSEKFKTDHIRSYASELLYQEQYQEIFTDLEEQVNFEGLKETLLATVPIQYRNSRTACTYPLHELACVKYFCTQGYETKLGPSSEKKYDDVMGHLRFPIEFSYLADAFALGTNELISVVHYIPYAIKGQRIYLEDNPHQVKAKVLQANPQALCALTNLALAAAEACNETPILPSKDKARKHAVSEILSKYIAGMDL
jgi:hypothetical protein